LIPITRWNPGGAMKNAFGTGWLDSHATMVVFATWPFPTVVS
jgi:hypothetical protein